MEKCEQWQNRLDIVPEEYLGDIYDGQVWMKFNSQTSLQHHTHKLVACIKYRLVSTIYTQCVLNGGNLFDYSKPSKMRPVQAGEYTPRWSDARSNRAKTLSQWILDSTCRRTEGVLGWNGTSNSYA